MVDNIDQLLTVSPISTAPPAPPSPGQFVCGRQQLLGVGVGVLGHADEVLVAAAVGLGPLQVATQAGVLPQEHVAVRVQPVQHLGGV